MSNNKHLKNFYFRENKFEENLVKIDVCDKYLPPNNHLYVEQKTGIVCSARTHSEKEILDFNSELGLILPYISENGASINGLDLLNSELPKELILSREKDDILNIFKNIVPLNLQNKCKLLSEMNKTNQSLIFGLEDKKLEMALDRKYTIPLIFKGSKNEKIELSKIIKKFYG